MANANRLYFEGARKVLPDFDELDPTDDFGDPDTYNYGSEHEPDVLDVLIAKEENPDDDDDEDEENTSLAVALGHLLRMVVRLTGAVGKYENCTGFDEYEIEGETVFPYDTIAEPPVRTKAIITSDDLYSRDEGSPRAMCNEQNIRRRQCYFTKRYYATVRGAVAIGENVFAISKQR